MSNYIDAETLFDKAIDIGDFYFLRDLVQARKQAGRTATAVLYDIARISFAKRKIVNAEHYFKYRLFETVSAKQPKSLYGYIDPGENLKLSRTVNFDLVKETAVDNKLHLESIARSYDLPVVKTQAVISRFQNLPKIGLCDEKEIMEFFRARAEYPLFGKPNKSSRSAGVVSIDCYDSSDDSLLFATKGKVPLADFVKEVLKQFGEYGFLLQSRIIPHKALQKLSGNAIGCVRVVTLVDHGNVEPLYAVWKIPASGSIADNFWRAGSRIAALNLSDGSVERIQIGVGVERQVAKLSDISDSNVGDFRIPEWEQLLEVCRQGASLFQNTPIIGWDVAVTENGPVIVEANTNPDHSLFQLAFDTGFSDSAPGIKLQMVAQDKHKLRAQKRKESKKRGNEIKKDMRKKLLKDGLKVNNV